MAITLNGTTGITDVNGTAAAPAITGTDTDSGMYFGTNTVGLSVNGANAFTADATTDIFYTNGTEKARIDTSGNFLVGTTSTGIVNSNNLNYRVGSGDLNVNHITGTSSGTSYLNFGYITSVIGSITQSGSTAVLYNVTSDQRLKENIQDADSASSLIDSLQVRQFDWKTDNTHQRYGFIAQELVTIAPEAVHQPVNEEEMMAVDYSKLVPMLVKEIQSLRTRIAALEAQ